MASARQVSEPTELSTRERDEVVIAYSARGAMRHRLASAPSCNARELITENDYGADEVSLFQLEWPPSFESAVTGNGDVFTLAADTI